MIAQSVPLLKNVVWLATGRLVGVVLAFLFYVALARAFGETGIGDYAFAFAISTLAGLVVEFGLRPLVTRRIARDPDDVAPYLGNLVAMQGVIALGTGLALAALALLLGFSERVLLLLGITFLATVIRSLSITFIAALEAIDAMATSAILTILDRLTMASAGLALIFTGRSIEVVTGAHLVGSAVFFLGSYVSLRREFGSIAPRFNLAVMRRTAIAALPFVGGAAFFLLYSRVDLMMLHQIGGTAAAGAYAAAYRPVEAVLSVAGAVGLAIYPSLVRATASEAAEGERLFLSSLKWMVLLGMAGFAVLFTAGDGFILAVFGPEFATSQELIRWMGLLFLLGCVKVPLWRLLIAANRERLQVTLQGPSIVLNIALNVALIPQFGPYGAVAASIASELFLVSFLLRHCAGLVRAAYVRTGVLVALAGGGIVSMGPILSRAFLWPVVAVLTLAGFVILSRVLGLITASDVRQLVSSVPRVWGRSRG